jgi:hypothetical protein
VSNPTLPATIFGQSGVVRFYHSFEARKNMLKLRSIDLSDYAVFEGRLRTK